MNFNIELTDEEVKTVLSMEDVPLDVPLTPAGKIHRILCNQVRAQTPLPLVLGDKLKLGWFHEATFLATDKSFEDPRLYFQNQNGEVDWVHVINGQTFEGLDGRLRVVQL